MSKSNLPSFDIVVVDDSLSIYNTAWMGKGYPIVFIYFSPECDHCQMQTDSILNNINSFRNARFFFISTDSLRLVKEFRNKYQFEKYPNVKIGLDREGYFLRHYHPKNIPTIAIFNRNKELKFMYDGGTSMNNLIGNLKDLY